ncbi:MAG TPA: UDP-glucose--hexose-1-phosphate uridylyltransferase [Anaerolineae bacterium]
MHEPNDPAAGLSAGQAEPAFTAIYAHRRLNPLTGEWVLVSPHRTQRPWQGQVEKLPPEIRPAYDPHCYLCPGNQRAGGAQNPAYEHTFVFDNDYAALVPLPAGLQEAARAQLDLGELIQTELVQGICRVVCFSPRHDLTLAEMAPAEIRRVIDVWAEQTEDLGSKPFIGHVQIFENRGGAMGASNPHPHGQIWATEQVPNEPAKEALRQNAYFAAHGTPMLADYLAYELAAQERLICENEHFVALVPYWAVWPFEALVLPRRPVQTLPELSDAARAGLADLLKRLTTRYDNVFEVSFPYSMGWHQRPVDGGEYPGWTLHAHFYPPLLRSATVRKFMVGFEMLGEPQRDIPAEAAAARLREVSEDHFRLVRG